MAHVALFREGLHGHTHAVVLAAGLPNGPFRVASRKVIGAGVVARQILGLAIVYVVLDVRGTGLGMPDVGLDVIGTGPGILEWDQLSGRIERPVCVYG